MGVPRGEHKGALFWSFDLPCGGGTSPFAGGGNFGGGVFWLSGGPLASPIVPVCLGRGGLQNRTPGAALPVPYRVRSPFTTRGWLAAFKKMGQVENGVLPVRVTSVGPIGFLVKKIARKDNAEFVDWGPLFSP